MEILHRKQCPKFKPQLKKCVTMLILILLVISFAVAIKMVNPVSARNALIAYWSFDEGTGNFSRDQSGNDNDAIIYGATWTQGKIGTALKFKGASEYVSIPELFSSNPTSLTISLWMNSRMNGTEEGVMFYHHGNSGEIELTTGHQLDNGDFDPLVVYFGVKLSDEIWYKVYSDSIAPDVWHNIVGVWVKGEYAELFVDGNLVNSKAVPDYYLQASDDTRFYPGLGVWNNDIVGPMYWYQGTLDEVIVYDYARTSEQIMQYNNLPSQPTASPTYFQSASPSPAKTPLSAGLVSLWKCEEGSGTVLLDSIGTNNGEISRAVFATGPSVDLGKALQFDGTSYVIVPNNPTLNPSVITVEAWIYIDQLPSDSAFPSPSENVYDIVSKFRRTPDYGYELHVLHDRLRFTVGADGWLYATGDTSLKAGQWLHVAGTYDGNTVVVYLNGVQDGLTTKSVGSTFVNSDAPLEIGCHHDLDGLLERSFKGRIDNIAFYNRALPSAEIASHYNYPSLPHYAPSATATVTQAPTSYLPQPSFSVEPTQASNQPSFEITLEPWQIRIISISVVAAVEMLVLLLLYAQKRKLSESSRETKKKKR